MAPDNRPTLAAEYASPRQSKAFRYPQQALSASYTTAEKTAYLASLRASVTQLQGEVNAFLTQKMEQDKVTDRAAGGPTTDDPAEEENYGEEIVEA